MFSYQAFGLGIHSDLPLPALVATEANPDVRVRVLMGETTLPDDQDATSWSLRMTPELVILTIGGVGQFRIRAGCAIEIVPAPGIDEALLALYVVGNVMALLLHQRGLFVLHASAVVGRDGVIAFMGQSGWGKSSIAAAMHLRGNPAVADDLTPVRFIDGLAHVVPGIPQLKLMPDVAACFSREGANLYCLHPTEEKSGWRVADRFPSGMLPLQRIYLLAPGHEPAIAPIRPPEALIELVRHSYPTRLLQPGSADHFRRAAELAGSVPIFRLTRASQLASLPELARLVEAHLTTAPA